jgi:hypothetical protein
MATVEPRHHRSVVQAADVCPGECIFIELDEVAGVAADIV